jgi:hypothetical protein
MGPTRSSSTRIRWCASTSATRCDAATRLRGRRGIGACTSTCVSRCRIGPRASRVCSRSTRRLSTAARRGGCRRAAMRCIGTASCEGRGSTALKQLGAFGADLAAVANFFEQVWDRPSPELSVAARSWVLSVAAFCLRGVGRLSESLEPLRAGLLMRVERDALDERRHRGEQPERARADARAPGRGGGRRDAGGGACRPQRGRESAHGDAHDPRGRTAGSRRVGTGPCAVRAGRGDAGPSDYPRRAAALLAAGPSLLRVAAGRGRASGLERVRDAGRAERAAAPLRPGVRARDTSEEARRPQPLDPQLSPSTTSRAAARPCTPPASAPARRRTPAR